MRRGSELSLESETRHQCSLITLVVQGALQVVMMPNLDIWVRNPYKGSTLA